MLTPIRHLGEMARSAATRRSRLRDDADALRGLEAVPLDAAAGLELEWLGVSGYRMTYEGVSLFVDPYLSRVPLRSLLLRRRALPDPALLERYPARGAAATSPACSSATRTSTTRSTRPRSRSASAARVRVRLARDADAAARARRPRRRGRAVPPLRARPVRRLLHAERALEADPRPARAVRRRAELRPPPRPHPRRLPLRAGLGDPHRGRRHELLPPGQRQPRRRGAAPEPRRRVPRGRRGALASRRATGSGCCRGWTRGVVVPTHYDDFFKPLGASSTSSATCACELDDEVRAVSRDATLAALPRVSERTASANRGSGES